MREKLMWVRKPVRGECPACGGIGGGGGAAKLREVVSGLVRDAAAARQVGDERYADGLDWAAAAILLKVNGGI